MHRIVIITVAAVMVAAYDPFNVTEEEECIPWWSYRGVRGQHLWCCDLSRACCGVNQSPVNIEISEARYDNEARCLLFMYYYCMPKSMALINNGHTVELVFNAINDSYIPLVRNGPLKGRRDLYQLDRIIFHWGRNSSYGSEHTLDGVKLPLEMQLIHRNVNYTNNHIALTKPDGFIIVSVLFVLSYKDNDNLRGIIYNLHRVTWKDQVACIQPFVLLKLLPPTYGHYYSYNGSLPMPPCTENVIWIVFHNPVPISEYQLNEFRRLQERTEEACPNRNCPMVDNYRKTTCLKNRIVKWKEECIGANLTRC